MYVLQEAQWPGPNRNAPNITSHSCPCPDPCFPPCLLSQYRCPLFHCTSLYCTSQMWFVFFLIERQDLPRAKRLQLTVQQYLLYCSGPKPNPQHWGMPVIFQPEQLCNSGCRHTFLWTYFKGWYTFERIYQWLRESRPSRVFHSLNARGTYREATVCVIRVGSSFWLSQ